MMKMLQEHASTEISETQPMSDSALITGSASVAPDVKISMRFPGEIWAGVVNLAYARRMEPVDFVRMLVNETVADADPPVLEGAAARRLRLLNELNRSVIRFAQESLAEGFSADITLRTLRKAMEDGRFRTAYVEYIGGGDPYARGTGRKQVNMELCWRIKNSLPVVIETKPDGKTPDEVKNLRGELVQSYTRLKLQAE